MVEQNIVADALDNLRVHQRQLDADGCEVGVSRQALNEAITYIGRLSADRDFWKERFEVGTKARIEAQQALSRTGAVKVALSGDTGELIDRMAAAIRDWGSHYDDGPWETLPEDRKAGWRGDAERALAVVKEYLTARRPAEQAVAEAMVEALRNIDAEAPAKEPRDDWTSTDLDEAFYEGKLRGYWEMAVYAREALTAALGAQTPPEGAVTEAARAVCDNAKLVDIGKNGAFNYVVSPYLIDALKAAMKAGRHD